MVIIYFIFIFLIFCLDVSQLIECAFTVLINQLVVASATIDPPCSGGKY